MQPEPGLSQKLCLSVGYVLLAGCLVWPQWERKHLASQRLEVQGRKNTQGSFTYSEEKGMGDGGMDMGRGDQEEGSEQM